MLTRLDLRGFTDLTGSAAVTLLRAEIPRPQLADESSTEVVRSIIDDVRAHGDEAIRRLTKQFDGVEITNEVVPRVALEAAIRDIPPLLREALEEAYEVTLAFHRSTKPEDTRYERDGVVVRQTWRPVERAGCYVPGGLAEYPSSVLMTAVPARVAGVDTVVLCVPPNIDGKIPASVLAAAAIAQVDEVHCVGGAQAIAAMAYGTESIAPVDVIVGPGNAYVATAKRLVSGVVGVPSSCAGPSEVVVIADDTTPPELAAIDLIVQAEHGPDGMSWLVTTSEEVADQITERVTQLVASSDRRQLIEANLAKRSYSVIVDDPVRTVDVANAIAPEHLQIMTIDPEALVPLVRHAGAVFVGTHAPASVGDYLAGPSHVLPVCGSARFASALGVRDFLREQHVIALDDSTLSRVAPHVIALAEAEGLEAHARSVRMRTRK